MATGPSSSATPYIVASEPNVRYTSIFTVGDSVNNKPGTTTPYRFVGIPDGIGAFDNGNGTMTVLVNHELGASAGVARAHGGTGAFVSKLIVNKADLSVADASDLIQTLKVWNVGTSSYVTATGSLNNLARLCSGDLAEPSAFYNAATGKGTQARIYISGEETGPEGRVFAHLVTGSDAGTSYELARLGNTSFENSVASAFGGDKTIILSTDDATPGQVYLYVGTKTDNGSDIEKAGLTNGQLYGIKAAGIGFNATSEAALNGATPTSGAFTLAAFGNVENMTGAQLETASDTAQVSEFWRPEDIAWDPTNGNVAYFVTTASFTGLSKLYKLTFTDINDPTAGGSYEVLLDGTEGQRMMDNISVNQDGTLILQEDVGNNARLGKVWHYDPATDKLQELGQHDPARFAAPTAPFNQDEESSGVIDVTSILGDSDTQAFLLDVQAHYTISGELVEGGQLLAMFIDEVKNGGAGNDRVAGDANDNFALNGFAGNDEMLGGSGNDGLLGGRGADTLVGGRGSDVLQGGLDADTFLFGTVTNTIGDFTAGANDIITDFRISDGDTINFGGATVIDVRVSFLAVEGNVNGIDLDNSARALDLEVTLVKGGVTQKVTILDAYNFQSNAYWEGVLGVDLTYPRPLPTGSAFVDIG
ncbi:hypothetical protein IP88_11385 [alpha proteobacterium AAP81b]|nr:hypothetical protein IP88_11385 [alpha proteobacterium AAP81b]